MSKEIPNSNHSTTVTKVRERKSSPKTKPATKTDHRESKKRTKTTNTKSTFTLQTLSYWRGRLIGRCFCGRVEERRWVQWVNGYRDVVEVDESETVMNQDLYSIISSCPGVLDGTKWLNITPPADTPNYRLWVLLASPPRPGHYHFSITGLQMTDNFGLQIILKQGRQVNEEEVKQSTAETNHLGQQRLWGQAQWLSTPLPPAILSVLTYLNIKDSYRLLVVVLVMCVVGVGKLLVSLAHGVREAHKMMLTTITILGQLIQDITPLLCVILGFVEKIFGGFFLLVAMVYRGHQQHPPPSMPPPPPPALRRCNTHALEQCSRNLATNMPPFNTTCP